MIYTIVNFTTQCGKNHHTDIASFATLIHTQKLIHCVAIFTILYGSYCPPHGEFELICIGKFARRTWVNFTQQYGKNRQGVNKINFTTLYGNYCYIFIENFPQKFSPCTIFAIQFYGLIYFHTLLDSTLQKLCRQQLVPNNVQMFLFPVLEKKKKIETLKKKCTFVNTQSVDETAEDTCDNIQSWSRGRCLRMYTYTM